MSFADKPFHERLKLMGDEAESTFERECLLHSIPFARYGFNRPDLPNFPAVPVNLRMTPDYVVDVGRRRHIFVECKGTGQVIKIKKEIFTPMEWWNEILPVHLFVYNSVEDGFCVLSVEELRDVVNQHGIWKQFKSDRKPYAEVPRHAFQFHKELQKCLSKIP